MKNNYSHQHNSHLKANGPGNLKRVYIYLTALLFLWATVGSIYSQAVYSNFGPGKKLERFTAISERMRCLCGCGLVLSTCPHVNCGFGIPARRMIEFMIEAGFTDQEILDGFEKGLLSIQGPELHKAQMQSSPLLKEYFQSSRPVWRDNEHTDYRRLQRSLVEDGLKQAQTTQQDNVDQAGAKGKLSPQEKLHRHFRGQFRRAAQIIAQADEKLASLPTQSPDREKHLTDKGMARGKLFTLASFMLGRGSRVKADGQSTTGLILSWLAGLLATGAVGYVLYRNLARAGSGQPNEAAVPTQSGPGSAGPKDPGGRAGDHPSTESTPGTTDGDDYEDQWKDWER